MFDIEKEEKALFLVVYNDYIKSKFVKHEFEHTPELDATIFTTLTWKNFYALWWFLSMRNLMKNTDILKVKKWVILADNKVYDSACEVAELFNMPSLIEVRNIEHMYCKYDINTERSYIFSLNKYSFLLLDEFKQENIETQHIIIQDADLMSSCPFDYYTKTVEFLEDNTKDVVMLNGELDISVFSSAHIIKTRFKDKTISKFITTEHEIISLFEKMNVPLLDFMIKYPVWRSSSFFAFNKDNKFLDNELSTTFLNVDFHCDETVFMVGAYRYDKNIVTLKEILDIPFVFYWTDIHQYLDTKFLFSFTGLPDHPAYRTILKDMIFCENN